MIARTALPYLERSAGASPASPVLSESEDEALSVQNSTDA
jgi:hypothetical protein